MTDAIRVDDDLLILVRGGIGHEIRLEIPGPSQRQRVRRILVGRAMLRFFRWLPGGWIMTFNDRCAIRV